MYGGFDGECADITIRIVIAGQARENNGSNFLSSYRLPILRGIVALQVKMGEGDAPLRMVIVALGFAAAGAVHADTLSETRP